MPVIRWQFVCEADLASRTIAWFSAGHFSHVDCVLDEDDDALIGARSDHVAGVKPGVRVRPAGYARFTHRTVLQMSCTVAQKRAYMGFLRAQVGKPYDSEALWAFVFNRDWRAPDSWICSELQAAACEASGLVRKLFLAANKITPVALALALSAAGAIEIQT